MTTANKIVTCLLYITFLYSTEVGAQNLLSVPFTSGFVGDNTGQNESSNSVTMASLGWSNFQFAQNSTATVFVSQGNDIAGFAIITDFNGVEHTIPGFIKWRAPSGTPTAMVFSPTSSFTLATNGSNGSSTYVINSTKYVGLILNGQTLTIPTNGSNAGKVTGNSAGLLTQLNSYLGTFPSLSVPNYSVNESAGKVTLTITLSASTTSTVTVNYATADSTATNSNDYTSKTGTITFSPGETSKVIEITITKDQLAEATELFKVIFTDAVNASIQKGTSLVTIIDDSSLPVKLMFFWAKCFDSGVSLSWATASEHNADFFSIMKWDHFGKQWSEIGQVQANGESSSVIHYEFTDNKGNSRASYRLVQYDFDGVFEAFDPVEVWCNSDSEIYPVYPNPAQGVFQLKMNLVGSPKDLTIRVFTMDGVLIWSSSRLDVSGVFLEYVSTEDWPSGLYVVRINAGNLEDLQLLVKE